MVTQATPLVLASRSPIRAQMLKQVGLQFSVAPSGVDEDAIKQAHQASLPELAEALAAAKAAKIASDYPQHLTIGCDQLCVMEDTVFDKPETQAKAIAQLQQLRGERHQQIVGLSLMRGEEEIWRYHSVAELTMRQLTDAEIKAYIALDEPLQSCGTYKFESYGRHLFTHVAGDHDVIKGLPLTDLLAKLHELGAVSL
ncbi:MAG: septum formation protein Maf [Rickettsiales bacterium]|nr:septum formation protein Maf [Rickettsiales bacterium]